MEYYPSLTQTIQSLGEVSISEERKVVLQPLIEYINQKLDQKEHIYLNFICTHNSRRSQFAQIWAQTAAAFYKLPVTCLSGGVEVTAFHANAIASLKRSGFKMKKEHGENPLVNVYFSDQVKPIKAFSKLFDDAENNAEAFAAVMTCSHADENCPFIPGTEKRIALNYEDPKAFDNTPEMEQQYDARSRQIAAELFYVMQACKR